MSDVVCIVSFANPKYTLKDTESYFLPAVKFASHNLKLRHDIDLSFYKFTKLGDAILVLGNVKDPEKFSCGNHLRGISQYMLKHKEQVNFSELLVGKRLLNYRKIKGGLNGEGA